MAKCNQLTLLPFKWLKVTKLGPKKTVAVGSLSQSKQQTAYDNITTEQISNIIYIRE